MTYEYVCQACGHQWEAEQSIKDAPLRKCESCGKNRAKRLVSGGTGFLLKGGGWYADGYGSGGGVKSDKPSDSPKSDAPAKKTEPKKKESKPADGGSKSPPSTTSSKDAKAS